MPLLQYRANGLQKHPLFDPLTSITLRIPVPDFRQMDYVTIDDVAADAWILLAVVKLKLPVVIATIRKKKAAGFQILTCERTADSAYRVPPSSN